MSRTVWSPAAEQDLEELAIYVAEVAHRPQAAEQLVEDILSKCDSYARQPGMGARHPELPASCRIFVHSRYVVIYTPTDDGIAVLRVFDSARDWPNVFENGTS